MGILSSLCLANTSYYSFNTLLRECGPGGTHTISFRDDLPEGLTTPGLYVDGTGHVLVKGPGGGDDGCPHRLAPGG